MSVPLAGTNLVRLLYLDESGTDHGASVLCVAGVLVHGDVEWPEVDRRLEALVERYVDPASRPGFFFHATDIYHGGGYFDRRKPEWNHESKRLPVLLELANLIEDMGLPVVFGSYQKDSFGGGRSQDGNQKRLGLIIHDAAAIDCLSRADRWLAKFAPSELATVVHEDGTPAKKMIKHTVRALRNPAILQQEGLSPPEQFLLRRIIDTVHFAEKSDARPLQLADLCAFILGRFLKHSDVPESVIKIIWKHLSWISDLGSFDVPRQEGGADQ